MPPPVITITRQYAAGGSDVARLVAAALDWTVIDNEFVDAVPRRAGLAPADGARPSRAAGPPGARPAPGAAALPRVGARHGRARLARATRGHAVPDDAAEP